MEYSMKKLIKWLAKVFDVNIVQEKIVTKEVVKEAIEYRFLTQGKIEGDVFVDGNLLVNGNLSVRGGVTIKSMEV
jgi:hypothetical protein